MDGANLIACDRLEKRRQAMLEMPKMIQEWKQVRSSPEYYTIKGVHSANNDIARPRSWVEKVAEIIGAEAREVDGLYKYRLCCMGHGVGPRAAAMNHCNVSYHLCV